VAERVLTLRELNRTTLARQLLLRRERLPVARAIERVGALQAQWAPAPYVALWSRLVGFERQDLERALVRGSVVKALVMRATMHLVSARDYPWLDACVREARTLVRVRGTDPPPARMVRRALALTRHRPHTRPELMRALGYDPKTQDPDQLREMSWIVALARLEQTPEAAFWGFRGSPLLQPVEHELPPREKAAAYLIRRYLAAIGRRRARTPRRGAASRSGTSPQASSRCSFAPSATSRAASCSIFPAHRFWAETRPPHRDCSHAGRSCCLHTRTGRESCPTSTASK
jgi:hypothetical protein